MASTSNTDDFNINDINIDDLVNDDEDDDAELITVQKLLENLENAWLNEINCPELLPHQSNVLDYMLGQISHMEENLKQLDKNDFRFITHKMELERIRYIIVSYLRCRLRKIETYTKNILNEDENRSEEEKRLSEDELKFAKDYSENVEKYFHQLSLQYLPNFQQSSQRLNDSDQRIVKPNLMSHVFIKANETVSSVVLGTDDEEVDLIAGSQHILPYQLISDLVLNGKKFLQNISITLRQSTVILKRIKMTSLARTFSSSTDTVLTQEINDKAVITLNRPKALNAINLEMVQKIKNYLKKWESTKQLVIIKGEGDKSFCAGGDVRAIVEAGPTKESKDFFRHEYETNAIIGNYKIPYIAIIDGITMGGGVGLSVHGKYRIATERTLFAMPETQIGLFPDVGGSYFLPRLQGKFGLFLGLTGLRLKGGDVQRVGIATHYCDSSKLPELEGELLKTKTDSEVVKVLEKFHSINNANTELEKHIVNANKFFNAESVEEIFKNLQNDGSDWSQSILKTLQKMSPTSLKVTFEELKRGENMSLINCLRMEYRLVVRHVENSDFKEGVRALLIDKDQQPKWNPPSIEQVTEQRVQSFFAKLPENEELKLDDLEEKTAHLGKSKL